MGVMEFSEGTNCHFCLCSCGLYGIDRATCVLGRRDDETDWMERKRGCGFRMVCWFGTTVFMDLCEGGAVCSYIGDSVFVVSEIG